MRIPALLLLVLCVAAVPAVAQTTPTPGAAATADDSPGTKVGVSLDEKFFERRLPFDVPFYLSGLPPAYATDILLTTFRTSSKDSLSLIATELEATKNCQPGPTLKIAAVSRSTWKGAAGSKSFALLVDALDPQRYYVFCFLSSGPVPAAEIDKPSRTILRDVATRFLGEGAPGAEGDLSLPFARAMQEQLGQEINRMGAARGIPASIPPGNLFDTKTPVERGSTFVRLISPLIDAYRNSKNRADDYTTRREQLDDVVGGLSAEVREFVTDAIVAALPPDAVPDRNAAITTTVPFAFGDYAVADLLEKLETAEDAARAKGVTEAVTAITDLKRRVGTLERTAQAYGRNYENLRERAQALLAEIALRASEVRVGVGSTALTADMNRNAYVSMDTGIAYSWALESMVFYAGTNIYFRPINKNAPLSQKGSFSRRFALTIGVTTSLKDSRRRAEDLRPDQGQPPNGTNSLLIGGGLRVTPSIRLGAGALIFRETDPNPLITKRSTAATPYVALAVDVNLGSLLKSFFPNN